MPVTRAVRVGAFSGKLAVFKRRIYDSVITCTEVYARALSRSALTACGQKKLKK